MDNFLLGVEGHDGDGQHVISDELRIHHTRSPAGKPIDRVSHHTQQTYYSRVRRYNVWKPLLQPIIATEIDARKITISGE